jgi:hypothetical protein
LPKTAVAQTIYTETLAKAAELHGSTQALASFLRVPEATLLRWMSGRAQMPLQAFLRLIEAMTQSESAAPSDPVSQETPQPEPLTFRIGSLAARCARCDGTQFRPVVAGSPLRMTSELACGSCGERVVRGDLIAQLAKDTVQHSRAMTASRARRQAAIPKSSPKLRALQKKKPETSSEGGNPA